MSQDDISNGRTDSKVIRLVPENAETEAQTSEYVLEADAENLKNESQPVTVTCGCHSICQANKDPEADQEDDVKKTSLLYSRDQRMDSRSLKSNWSNYIVKILDSNGNGLYVRADNYGWVVSDNNTTVLADGATEPTFGSGSSDWSAWEAAMQAGAEVTVVVKVDGRNITIINTANDETFTVSATFSDEVGTELTVCLSGEDCVLTDLDCTLVTDDGNGGETTTYPYTRSLSTASACSANQKAVEFVGSGTGATISYANLSACLGSGNENGSMAVYWYTSGGNTQPVFYFAQAEETGYYFADNVTLAVAESNPDGSYLIYTVDAAGNYYLVQSDGTLMACDDLSSMTSDEARALSSAGGGAYYWGLNSSNKDVLKITSLDSFVLSDFLWTLESGDGGYSLYNSASGNYLSPAQAVSESISGNLDSVYTWQTIATGKNYSMNSDEVLVITVECTSDVEDTAIFNVELVDTMAATVNSTEVTQYITTWSNGESGWFALPTVSDPTQYVDLIYYDAALASPYESSKVSMSAGNVYTITISRTDAESGTSGLTDYTITYYDGTGNTLFSYIATDTQMSSDSVYAHIIAQVGTFNVSVAYATPVTNANEISADCSNLTIGEETTETENTAQLDIDKYRTGEQGLTGDFDITYTFKNSNTSRDTSIGRVYLDWNYVLVFETGDSSHVYLYASGDGSGTTKTTTISYGDGSSFAAIQESSSSTWTRIIGSMSAGWLIDMNYGTDCTINITRNRK